MWRRGYLIMLFGLLVALTAGGQVEMDSLAQRVNLFGTQLPQEKVFVHLDNSAYFLGDTIYYQAYVTRTDRGTLSTLSGVLYVELLNADGYLVERQIVQLQSGMGQGSIVLNTGRAHYAGYYELRAYTRWMLNFGRTTLQHNRFSEDWFVRRHMAQDYYVDYDKLYSRTFPVYDAPLAHGEFYPDMTLRPMQRLMGRQKSDEQTVLRLMPEGGMLAAGVANRLYFEASTSHGRHLRGTVTLTDDSGAEVARAETEHRGKGVLEFTPREGTKYRATLTCADGQKASLAVPVAIAGGIALQPTLTADSLVCEVGGLNGQDLMMTVMHSGVVCHWQTVDVHVSLPLDSLPTGVLDITIYNKEGRIMADRLVFNPHGIDKSRIAVEGVQQQYTPYQRIDLMLRRTADADRKTVVSVSVTDADNSDQSTDNGNILTEMLLCSELKGFIEQPGYYFDYGMDTDTDTLRTLRLHHLDLLMATQGWRRFSWYVQSKPERFTINHLNEARTPRMAGAVYTYEAIRKADPLQEEIDAEFQAEIDENMKFPSQAPGPSDADKAYEAMLEMQGKTGDTNAHGRYQKNPGNLKRDVTVHAEFVQPGEEPLVGEAMTDHSMFNIEQPEFYGQFYMHLAAADTSKWGTESKTQKDKKGKKQKLKEVRHSWVVADEDEFPEFYVRIADPFPRHPHPYAYYRTQLVQPETETKPGTASGATSVTDDHNLAEVVVRRKRGGKRRFDASHPALVMTSYRAFNQVCDAGLCPGQFVGAERLANDVARLLMGDMGVDRQYHVIVRRNGLPSSHTMSEAERASFNLLENLDSIFVYTDYAPRLYGNAQWEGDNQPEVIVDVRKAKNNARQMTYRDRFYVRQGFNVCEDFYQPDYSQATPAPIDGTAADLRRTLLWIPAAMLGDDGTLSISTYNNGKPTHIRVTVNGIDAKGTPLSN